MVISLFAQIQARAPWANVRPPLEPLSEERGQELADRLRREVAFDILCAKAPAHLG